VVEFEFDYKFLRQYVAEGGGLRSELQEHRVVAIFNHKDFWTLLEIEGGDQHRHQKIKYEYEKIEGIPFVRSHWAVSSDRNTGDNKSEVSLVNRFNQGRIGKRDFTVLAFGFPEPIGFKTEASYGLRNFVVVLTCLMIVLLVYLNSRVLRSLFAFVKGGSKKGSST